VVEFTLAQTARMDWERAGGQGAIGIGCWVRDDGLGCGLGEFEDRGFCWVGGCVGVSLKFVSREWMLG
jgi:hypothetical protein